MAIVTTYLQSADANKSKPGTSLLTQRRAEGHSPSGLPRRSRRSSRLPAQSSTVNRRGWIRELGYDTRRADEKYGEGWLDR